MNAPPRIVIAAGGTAGHVVPAIAVADALRAEGAEVSFVGGERAEAELVPAGRLRARHDQRRGHQPHEPAQGRPRASARRAPRSARARKILKRRRADAVLGGGGYVAGPVGLAAALQQDPARARRGRLATSASPTARCAPRARRVCLAFPLEGRDGDRYRVTGRAGPADDHRPRRTPARSSASAPDETCVLVFGGSLGARSINQAALEAFEDAPYRVVHVAGTRDFPTLAPPGPALRPARLPDAVRRSRSPRPTSPSPAPAARCSSSPSTACRRVLIPYPHAVRRPPDARTPAGWPTRGAAVDPPRRRADARAPARGGRRAARRPQRRAAMAAPPARSRSPDAAQESPPRCSRSGSTLSSIRNAASRRQVGAHRRRRRRARRPRTRVEHRLDVALLPVEHLEAARLAVAGVQRRAGRRARRAAARCSRATRSWKPSAR